MTKAEITSIRKSARKITPMAYRLISLCADGVAMKRDGEKLSFTVRRGETNRMYDFPASALRDALVHGVVKATKLASGFGYVETTKRGSILRLHVSFGPRGGRYVHRAVN